MDQYRSRLKLSENFERHWSIRMSGEIHMDQSLVHIFSWGNSCGPMVLKVLLKFPPTLALVHGWLFPGSSRILRRNALQEQANVVSGLSGPTATVILLRHTVALHSVALRFQGFGGVSQEDRATPPEKGPVAPIKGVCHTSNGLLEGIAVQGGVAATLSPVVLQWGTKSMGGVL